MSVIQDTNIHTVSGTVWEDAQFKGFPEGSATPTSYRFRLRIGSRKLYRRGNDLRSRMTWFNIKFEVPADGFPYYRDKLKKDARILVSGEQLVDEDDGPAGRRYWHFIRATTINVLVEASVTAGEGTQEPAQQEPAQQSQQPVQHAPVQKEPQQRMPPPPRQSAQGPEQPLKTSAPSFADAKDDSATKNRHKHMPENAFETHFTARNW
ncbi:MULTISPECIES: hypothetical protein [unclassified Dyella]|uniref:hypothetical protein n=1 Tax=Dyella sp. ASV21 TaxID=2795114 RepID=UPI0018ECD844|nr:MULTISPECIES: hypothetical protein [unclassified Dyella]